MWRGGSGKGGDFEKWPCPWQSRVVLVMEKVEARDWARGAVEGIREGQRMAGFTRKACYCKLFLSVGQDLA
jgi:hypothetical protein